MDTDESFNLSQLELEADLFVVGLHWHSDLDDDARP